MGPVGPKRALEGPGGQKKTFQIFWEGLRASWDLWGHFWDFWVWAKFWTFWSNISPLPNSPPISKIWGTPLPNKFTRAPTKLITVPTESGRLPSHSPRFPSHSGRDPSQFWDSLAGFQYSPSPNTPQYIYIYIYPPVPPAHSHFPNPRSH